MTFPHIHDENCTHSKGGRPPKYHDKMPGLFIEAMKQGKTIAMFASEQDICTETVRAWSDEIPEFSAAFTNGRTKCQSHWEHWLDQQLLNPKANAALIKMKFVNQFGYADKKEVDNRTTISVSKETDRKVREIIGD